MNNSSHRFLIKLKNNKVLKIKTNFGRKYYINSKFILISMNINLSKLIMEFAKKFMTEKAEKFNGKAAMVGMFALVGAYYFTGQIVPGIF